MKNDKKTMAEKMNDIYEKNAIYIIRAARAAVEILKEIYPDIEKPYNDLTGNAQSFLSKLTFGICVELAFIEAAKKENKIT